MNFVHLGAGIESKRRLFGDDSIILNLGSENRYRKTEYKEEKILYHHVLSGQEAAPHSHLTPVIRISPQSGLFVLDSKHKRNRKQNNHNSTCIKAFTH